MLEFLDLKDEYSESDLEEALIHRLEDFLLELGGDFSFRVIALASGHAADVSAELENWRARWVWWTPGLVGRIGFDVGLSKGS